VVLCVDDIRLKASLEHMTTPLMAGVEALRLDPVQPVHSLRKRFTARLQEKVIVRRHEAVRMAHPEKCTRRSRELFDEVAAIHVVAKEIIALDRARSDVKEAVVQVAAWPPRHGRLITGASRPVCWLLRFEAKSSRFRNEGLSLVIHPTRAWP